MPYDPSEIYVVKVFRKIEERHKTRYLVMYIGDESINPDSEYLNVTLDGPRIGFEKIKQYECLYESDNLKRAAAARVLLTLFEKDELVAPSGCVPAKIAVEDRPTVALYLWAYERLAREEVAELLGVKPDTVTRYKSRLFRG